MQSKKNSIHDWPNIFLKFKSYSGSALDFCRLNNISVSCFYTHKKKYLGEASKSDAIFHKVSLEEKHEAVQSITSADTSVQVNLEISAGKISLVLTNPTAPYLSELIKGLNMVC